MPPDVTMGGAAATGWVVGEPLVFLSAMRHDDGTGLKSTVVDTDARTCLRPRTESVFTAYRLQRLTIAGAHAYPGRLVQRTILAQDAAGRSDRADALQKRFPR